MSLNRYAKKVDSNQKDIVDRLRKLKDLDVEILGGAVDLLLGYKGKNFWIEVKTKTGDLTDKQKKLLQTWKGQLNICRSYEDILEVIEYVL